MNLRSWIPWRREGREVDLDEEIRAHLRMAEAERVARGESPEAAAAGARREFGNVGLVKEITRGMWGGLWLERLSQDLRFGVRMLARSPGFSILAVLCLTLGIGANAAVFSWIEGVLLRPYHLVAHQERLLVLAGTVKGETRFDNVSWPDFRDLQRNSTLIEAFVAEKISGAALSIGDRAEWATGSVVSSNYFEALGIRPILGRGFEPSEDSGRNAHPVIVISHRMWKQRLNGDPGIIGKTQMLNGLAFTVIGVAPEGFYGTFMWYSFEFWAPASMQAQFDSAGYKLENRGERWIEGFVRLKRGVTARHAQDEISAVARRLEADYPATNRGRGIALVPLWKAPFNIAASLYPTLAIALGVVVFVLLIACANVSNLLLVKAFGRRHEMTVRLALGSGRGRLVTQLLTEGLILSALASAGGLAVAYGLRNALVLIIPFRSAPVFVPGSIDGRVVAVCVGACLVATLLFALVPAIQAGEIDLASALKAESAGVVGGKGKSRIRSILVVAQVSLSFLLLVGAGLLVQSMRRIRNDSPGFSTRGVLVTAVNLFGAGYDTQRARIFEDQLLDRVRGLGGVESAALSRVTPFSYRTYSSAAVAVEGYEKPLDEQPPVEFNEVSPGYFGTLGIPLLSGREFTGADEENAPLVAIVNEPMVSQYWRGQDPIGQRLQVKDRWMRVVGVAKLARYRSVMETPRPFFYVPLRQNFSRVVGLDIRTARDPRTMAAALAREVHELDPNLATYEMITMLEQIDRSTSSQRIATALLGVFGGLALLLAGIGLYGVMSYAVSQSTRDLGLRMALGARESDLLRLVMSHGLALTAGGVILGAALALMLTRLLGYLLYKVSPRDPAVFGLALAVMAIASLAACFFPAWRAMRTDPVKALRT